MTPNPHPEVPEPHEQHATDFLDLLGRSEFEFRCLMDNPARKAGAAMVRHCGPFDRVAKTLRTLNDQGYGIFVQVNPADGQGNKAANIVAAPCFFADLDGAPRTNLDRLELQPHVVIETSPGKWHAYWRVSDIPLPAFKPIQQRLARLFDSDPSVNDLPRVMRLPGYLHQKNPDAPYLVQPVHQRDHPPFSLAEFSGRLEEAEQQHGLDRGPATTMTSPLTDEVARSEMIIRQLCDAGQLDLGRYDDWLRAAMALKGSHGEAGWPVWLRLSQTAPKYGGEAECRVKWESIGTPADGRPLTMASLVADAKAAGCLPDARTERGRGKAPDAAVAVMQLVTEAGDELWLDREGRPHVSYLAEHNNIEVKRHVRLDSATYRRLLGVRYHNAYPTKVLSGEQEGRALQLLEHRAHASGVRHRAFLRVADHDGRLYIDLGGGDGRAVEIDAMGWRVVTAPPVRFVRGSRGELPLPEPGGARADFARHLNLDDDGITRAVAVAMAALTPWGPYPICLIEGEQGSGKSTIGDMILALTDPPGERRNGRFSFTSQERDLHVHAQQAHMLYFDNMSAVGAGEADALCRLVTGAATSYRKLHTNDEEVRFVVLRPVIVTCIGTPTSRGDFLSRTVRLTAQRVDRRLTEERLWAAFERDRPKLFGYLLDSLACALRNKPRVLADVESGALRLPRLAEFAALVEAAADALELEPGAFAAMLTGEQREVQAESAIGDPIVAGLVRHFSAPTAQPLHLSASELLKRLREADLASSKWPSANRVRPALMRHAAGLRALGLEVEFCPPAGKANVYTFRISATAAFRAEAAIAAVTGWPSRGTPF